MHTTHHTPSHKQPLRALVTGWIAACLLTGPVAAQQDTPSQNTDQIPFLHRGQDAIPSQVDEMYTKGIRYLANTQTEEGNWPDTYGRLAGVVGLAVMALMSTGEDPNSGPYADNIRKALDYILKQQNEETGYIGDTMYNHGFATLALAEAYGVVDMPGLGSALQKAVDLSLTAQQNNRQGSWRYNPSSRDADTSVAGAVLVSLYGARNAGIAVPDEAFEDALDYFDSMRTSNGGYGYSNPSHPNFNRTAIGLLIFSLSHRDDEEHLKKSIDYLSSNLNYRDPSYAYYFEYYMSQALFQADLELWEKWNKINIRYLSTIQSPDGSWPGSNGTTFSTSAALLSLALNYRLLPIYER